MGFSGVVLGVCKPRRISRIVLKVMGLTSTSYHQATPEWKQSSIRKAALRTGQLNQRGRRTLVVTLFRTGQRLKSDSFSILRGTAEVLSYKDSGDTTQVLKADLLEHIRRASQTKLWRRMAERGDRQRSNDCGNLHSILAITVEEEKPGS
jgi:hypothetical protein